MHLGQGPGDLDVDMGITGGVGDPLELVKTVSGLGVRLGLFRLGETLGLGLGLPHLSLHLTKRVAMWWDVGFHPTGMVLELGVQETFFGAVI